MIYNYISNGKIYMQLYIIWVLKPIYSNPDFLTRSLSSSRVGISFGVSQVTISYNT